MKYKIQKILVSTLICFLLIGCGDKQNEINQASYTEEQLNTVKGVKSFLSDHGFYKGTLDENWSEVTKKAVEKFQVAAKINADGVVGPETRSNMLNWKDSPHKKDHEDSQSVLAYFEKELLGKSRATATCREMNFDKLKSDGKLLFSSDKCRLVTKIPDDIAYGYKKERDYSPINIRGIVSNPKGKLYIVSAEEWLYRDMFVTNFFYLDGQDESEILGWSKFRNSYGFKDVSGDAAITSERMYHEMDPSCCHSYEVISKYKISDQGITLIERATKITKFGHENMPTYAKWKKDELRRKEEAKKEWQAKLREAERLSRKISSVSSNPYTSKNEKAEKIRVLQRNAGEEIFTSAMRMVPIYDKKDKKFRTLDSHMRREDSRSSSRSSTPFERDPVGSGMSIFFNSSSSNIKKQLGLP
jgi:hypothetical protein